MNKRMKESEREKERESNETKRSYVKTLRFIRWQRKSGAINQK